MPNHDDAADYDSLPALRVMREPRGHPGCRYYGNSHTILRATKELVSSGGMVVGIGVIAGTECVVMANDPSVLGGALDGLLGEEVDARPRDRARQPDPLRQLRRVRRSRPSCRQGGGGRCRRATSPRADDSSTT